MTDGDSGHLPGQAGAWIRPHRDAADAEAEWSARTESDDLADALSEFGDRYWLYVLFAAGALLFLAVFIALTGSRT